jgi:hypothetical protein
MPIISVDASKGQISKLRNGHPVRIKKGSGFNIIVHPNTYNIVSRAFGRNKGVQLKLSNEELEANRNPSLDQMVNEHNSVNNPESNDEQMIPDYLFNGQGIFGHKFDQGAEHYLGKRGKKKLYGFARDVLRPIAKTGIMAGLAAGTASATALQPELAPIIIPVAAGTADLINDYIDKPSDFYDKPNKTGLKAKKANTLAKQFAKTQANEMMNQRFGTNYDYMGRAGLEQALSDKVASQLNQTAISARYATPPQQTALNQTRVYGEGFHHRRGRHDLAIIGRGGGQLANGEIPPPALDSQPLGANFQMRFFLPPQYQIKGNGLGTGLYAGRGLGTGLYT